MLTLNDAALILSLVSVLLALKGSPRTSMLCSALAMFYSIWGRRWHRWLRRAGSDGG